MTQVRRRPGLSPIRPERLDERLVPTRPGFARALSVNFILIVLALGLRMVMLPHTNGVYPGAPFFPAVTLAAVYAGWRWGLASTAISIFVLWGAREFFGEGWDAAGYAGLTLFTASAVACVLVAATLRSAVISLRDLGEQRDAAEADLSRAQRRLQLAQEVGGVGLWDWDMTTGEGYWSDAVYRNLGLEPSRQPDMEAMFAAIHPEDRERVRAVNRAARTQGRMEPVEYRVPLPDGRVRWLLSRGEVLTDSNGKPLRAVGVNIDVTEQRLAEEAVRESEARFRALADSAPALMWVSRIGGAREFVNNAYAAFVGGGYQAALTLDWRDRLHPDDLPRIIQEQIAGETSRKPFTLEARYKRGDGEWRWLRSWSQPRHGPDGEFAGFIGIAFDVTEAKQVEDDLTRINDLLAERVEQALTQRDEAQAQLVQSQKLEALGQLTGGVAHDFNNLLTVIIGALDILQRHPEDPARIKRLTEAALTASRRGERLTQQLLAFSRRQPLRPEIACVDDMLRESETLYRRAVGEAVNFKLELGAAGACSRVDLAQFEAALVNLLVNARDALPDGTGAITVTTSRLTLTEPRAGAGAGEYLAVAVKDNGAGMDTETIARVFEPFFTTKAVGKGTGLGLSQVYGFASQSGGGVEIKSKPRKGTTVTLLIPFTDEPRRAAEVAPRRARRAALTVLVVEDDAEVGELVQAMLEELGHTVMRAQTAAAALKVAVRDKDIGLVLTDVIMPGGRTGVDLAHAITAKRPGLPVILTSGYTGEALADAEAAPWPLLRKPYAIDELDAAIAAALDGMAEV
ncbi:MAG TPA: PAS domain-containing protein [Caulobacteraceae bacterium]